MKGQSVLEYLLIYGWGILAIIIVAALLWALGFFNPQPVENQTNQTQIQLQEIAVCIQKTYAQSGGMTRCTPESGGTLTFICESITPDGLNRLVEVGCLAYSLNGTVPSLYCGVFDSGIYEQLNCKTVNGTVSVVSHNASILTNSTNLTK